LLGAARGARGRTDGARQPGHLLEQLEAAREHVVDAAKLAEVFLAAQVLRAVAKAQKVALVDLTLLRAAIVSRREGCCRP
jgi:hypothetical protein